MSIKNIIFDLGGVVFNWKPLELIETLFSDYKVKKALLDNLLNSEDWLKLDQGVISRVKAVENSTSISGVDPHYSNKFLDSIPKALSLKEEMVAIIKSLKNQNYNLYVLSNMHKDFAEYLLKNYDFWNNFTDIIFSCDVKMIKPNQDIYKYILDKNSLSPNETIFIDDTYINIQTAEKLGIKTILYKNSKDLEKELSNI